jgi:hypothetical protein
MQPGALAHERTHCRRKYERANWAYYGGDKYITQTMLRCRAGGRGREGGCVIPAARGKSRRTPHDRSCPREAEGVAQPEILSSDLAVSRPGARNSSRPKFSGAIRR